MLPGIGWGRGVSFGIIEALRAARPEETLELVHRLDRDTSGCLLVARKPAALRVLHALIRDPKSVRSWPTMQMPGFAKDQMSDREIDQIIAYLTHMARRGETR